MESGARVDHGITYAYFSYHESQQMELNIFHAERTKVENKLMEIGLGTC